MLSLNIEHQNTKLVPRHVTRSEQILREDRFLPGAEDADNATHDIKTCNTLPVITKNINMLLINL